MQTYIQGGLNIINHASCSKLTNVNRDTSVVCSKHVSMKMILKIQNVSGEKIRVANFKLYASGFLGGEM